MFLCLRRYCRGYTPPGKGTDEAPEALLWRLVGDEIQYEGVAYTLLRGEFFHWPGWVPVYPLFIAATYYALGERSPAKLVYRLC